MFSTTVLQEELAGWGVGAEGKNKRRIKSLCPVSSPRTGNGTCKGPEVEDIEIYLKQ